MLYLDTQVRISSNQTFNAQEAYQATFEDVMLEQNAKIEETNQKQQKSTFFALGMPPGFNLDTSLLEEMDNLQQF